MLSDSDPGVQLEIGHVLYMDVVGYSKLLINDQRELQSELGSIVRNTQAFRAAEATGQLVRLPVGDGMALVFFNSPEAPVLCALEIGKALKNHPVLQLRMGIHSGPISQLKDVNDRTNIAGAGINIAQRVMDCADAGHILLSKRVAEDLAQSRQWQPHLHDLGECPVKHEVRLPVVNLYTDEAGNPEMPEKVRKAREQESAEEAAGRPASTFRRRSVLIVSGALVAAGLAAALFAFFTSSSSDKSIAVLPFENLSADKENAFFADGIQDDILTSLAQIEGLRVISRTSVMNYRGEKSAHNLKAISKALDVGNVLEGSVRRDGDRVVVNVQLIDARHDRHLWAKRYDRPLEDSLGLQGELAREIAEALRATLTPEEAARVKLKPTNNAQAYDLYLQARHYEFKPDTFLQDYRTAEQLYVQAITLDPNFALAHARLAATRARIYHFYEPTEAWRTGARTEADLALKLQPSLGEGHHALGLCYYWFDRNYAAALREFEIAKTLLPNDSSVPWDIAAIKRRQGRWQETVSDYRRILTLDPQNANVVRDLLYVYCAMRDWPNAEANARRLLALSPDSVNAKVQIGYVEFWAKGNTALLKKEMASVPSGEDPDGAVTAVRIDTSLIDRDPAAAERALLNSSLATISYLNGVDTPRSFFAGEIALMRGDKSAAEKELAHARDLFAAATAETPGTPERHAALGLACALLGEKERAIAEGKRAVELRPEAQDAVDGTLLKGTLALIYARVGENDQALTLLEHLFAVPGAVDTAGYSVTVNDLKRRWEWDPLRSDPRFQKLIRQ